MDVKWKDGEGNILNADDMKIKYLSANGEKYIISKDKIKKITIEDGLLNIFKDFDNDLELTVVIPKKNKRDAVKIFNEYDKTGKMLKRKTGNFLIDLILESSVSNPIYGLSGIILVLLILIRFVEAVFGEIALSVIRIAIISYVAYLIISYIFLRVKRKKLKENCL